MQALHTCSSETKIKPASCSLPLSYQPSCHVCARHITVALEEEGILPALNRHLNEFVSERAVIETDLDASYDPFVRYSVPVEVATQIFMFCIGLPNETLTWPNVQDFEPAVRRMLVPYRLASVCQAWRDVALSIPYIWVNVIFNISRFLDDPEGYLAMGLQHLSRSRSLPLYLFLVEDGSKFCPVPLFLKLVDICNSQHHRWTYLHLSVSESFIPLMGAVGNGIPSQLRTLAITLPRFASLSNPLSIRMNGVSMKPVIIYAQFLDFNALLNGWARTTTITLHRISAGEFLSLLEHAPCLESCSFAETYSIDRDIFELDLINHLSLRELVNPPIDALTYISLPNLISLSLWSDPYTTDDIADFFHSLRSLRSLRLEGGDEELDAISALSYLPTLKSLSLDLVAFSVDALLDFLVKPVLISSQEADHYPFLPRLEEFAFASWGSIPYDKLLALPSFRPLQNAKYEYRPLRSVHVLFCANSEDPVPEDDYIPTTVIPQIENVRKQGAEFVFHHAAAHTPRTEVWRYFDFVQCSREYHERRGFDFSSLV